MIFDKGLRGKDGWDQSLRADVGRLERERVDIRAAFKKMGNEVGGA